MITIIAQEFSSWRGNGRLAIYDAIDHQSNGVGVRSHFRCLSISEATVIACHYR